jgi:hypothetical protein
MIRQAFEETFGASLLPNPERAETALQECELIAKAIYSLHEREPRRGSDVRPLHRDQ